MAHIDAPLPRCATDATRGNLGKGFGEMGGNVLIGEPVEPVAAHALRIERLGNGIAIGDLGVPAMKGRIEAGNLQQMRLARGDQANEPEVMGLVQRRERRQAFELV